MDIILNQFKKDFLRLRVPFILCLIPPFLLLLLYGISQLGHSSSHVDLSQGLSGPSAFTVAINIGLLFVGSICMALPYILIPFMIPMLIHEDSVVGHVAFWLSRPITRTQLLLSKSLYVGLLVLVILLNYAFSQILHPSSVPDLIRVMVIWSFKTLAAGVVLMLISSITENLRDFIITQMGATFVFIFFSVGLWIYKFATSFQSGHISVPSDPSLALNQQLVSCIAFIVLGGALVIRQFLTRRTRFTILAGAGALLIISILASFWPWDLVHFSDLPPSSLQIKVDSSQKS